MVVYSWIGKHFSEQLRTTNQLPRIVSMTFGRLPTPTTAFQVPLFSAVDDEHLETSDDPLVRPQTKLSLVAFAVQNVKLSEILGEVLNHLYRNVACENLAAEGDDVESIHRPSFDAATALEVSLSRFEADVPSRLRWDNPVIVDDQLSRQLGRQRFILSAR